MNFLLSIYIWPIFPLLTRDRDRPRRAGAERAGRGGDGVGDLSSVSVPGLPWIWPGGSRRHFKLEMEKAKGLRIRFGRHPSGGPFCVSG